MLMKTVVHDDENGGCMMMKTLGKDHENRHGRRHKSISAEK
jgi:hypothetical protein